MNISLYELRIHIESSFDEHNECFMSSPPETELVLSLLSPLDTTSLWDLLAVTDRSVFNSSPGGMCSNAFNLTRSSTFE